MSVRVTLTIVITARLVLKIHAAPTKTKTPVTEIFKTIVCLLSKYVPLIMMGSAKAERSSHAVAPIVD
jgi:hypothetical protein